jgi:hypothetical protein
LPEDGRTHELVMSPRIDFFHGSISSQLSVAVLQTELTLAGANG